MISAKDSRKRSARSLVWAFALSVGLLAVTGLVPATALTGTNQAETLGVTETLYVSYDGGSCNGYSMWKITGLSIKVTRTGNQQVPYVHTGAEQKGPDCTGTLHPVEKKHTFNTPSFGTKHSVPNWPSWPFATNQAPILAIGAYAHLHVQLGPPSFSTGTACAIVIFNSSESCHAF